MPTVTPRQYARITAVALVLLVLIVFTGAGVRLTGSGLGCPTWPECHGAVIQTELDTHGAIEYGNRLLTGVVAFGAVLAFLTAFLRRPFRRDLAILATLMPLGVAAQAVLGGMAVLYGLAPGWVTWTRTTWRRDSGPISRSKFSESSASSSDVKNTSSARRRRCEHELSLARRGRGVHQEVRGLYGQA